MWHWHSWLSCCLCQYMTLIYVSFNIVSVRIGDMTNVSQTVSVLKQVTLTNVSGDKANVTFQLGDEHIRPELVSLWSPSSVLTCVITVYDDWIAAWISKEITYGMNMILKGKQANCILTQADSMLTVGDSVDDVCTLLTHKAPTHPVGIRRSALKWVCKPKQACRMNVRLNSWYDACWLNLCSVTVQWTVWVWRVFRTVCYNVWFMSVVMRMSKSCTLCSICMWLPLVLGCPCLVLFVQ